MSLEKARSALQFIPADDRDVWVKIGMALKSEFGDDAFDLWDYWGQKSDSYNVKSAVSVWKTIRSAGKISIGTLFHVAKLSGWISNEPHQEPSKEELEVWRSKREQRNAQAHAEELRKIEGYKKAALQASAILKTCKPDQHNYLRSKSLVETIALVTPENELFVPMRDLEKNQLVGAQIIKWDMNERVWIKKMLPGMRAKGAVFRLGASRSEKIWLCEGYATGLSIEAALRRISANASVLVCFSDRNMVHVASMVKGNKYVFADHDKSGAGQRAANDIGALFCMSPMEGEDANDWHARAGILAVSKAIMETHRQ